MKTCIAVAALVGAFVACGGEQALCRSGEVSFSLDTTAGTTLVTSLDDAVALSCRAGQKITAVSEGDPVPVTLLESAAASGSFDWTPEAGGLWTLTNSVEGSATFVVRYSLFPESGGDGTPDNPARIVDDGEIPELVEAGIISAGYVFSLGGLASVGSISLPDGLALENIADETYRFISSTDGMLYKSAASSFAVDSRRSGPDRRWRLGEPAKVGYSGDNWTGGAEAEATLTIASPSGTVVQKDFSGTGACDFIPDERGVYKLTLTGGGQSIESKVSVLAAPLLITVR